MTDATLNPQNLFTGSTIHLQANVHADHYRAILEFIRKLKLSKDYGRALGLNVLFSILETVSGKVRLNYSMLGGDSWAQRPSLVAEEIKRIRETNQIGRTLEMVPLVRKIFEFGKQYANNFEFAIYIPQFSAKLSVVLPQLEKLLSALVTPPQQ